MSFNNYISAPFSCIIVKVFKKIMHIYTSSFFNLWNFLLKGNGMLLIVSETPGMDPYQFLSASIIHQMYANISCPSYSLMIWIHFPVIVIEDLYNLKWMNIWIKYQFGFKWIDAFPWVLSRLWYFMIFEKRSKERKKSIATVLNIEYSNTSEVSSTNFYVFMSTTVQLISTSLLVNYPGVSLVAKAYDLFNRCTYCILVHFYPYVIFVTVIIYGEASVWLVFGKWLFSRKGSQESLWLPNHKTTMNLNFLRWDDWDS